MTRNSTSEPCPTLVLALPFLGESAPVIWPLQPTRPLLTGPTSCLTPQTLVLCASASRLLSPEGCSLLLTPGALAFGDPPSCPLFPPLVLLHPANAAQASPPPRSLPVLPSNNPPAIPLGELSSSTWYVHQITAPRQQAGP